MKLTSSALYLSTAFMLSSALIPRADGQAPASAPAAAAALTPEPDLLAIPGIQADMSMDAALDVAAKAVQSASFDNAQKILDAVIKQDRENIRALSLLASCFERQAQQKQDSGDPAEVAKAEGFVQRAIDVYTVLGPLKSKAREYRDAEQMLTRILLHRPNDAPAQLELARLLAETDRQIMAIDRYREYMRNPAAPPETLAKVHIELGRLYRQTKMLAQAITTLQAGLKLNPENPEVHIEMALTYRAGGDWNKARHSADTAINKSQDNPEYYDVVASILLAQGNLMDGVSASRKAISLARARLSLQSDDRKLWQSLYGYSRTNEQVLRAILARENSGAARIELVHVMRQRVDVSNVLEAYVQLDVLRAAPESESRSERFLEALAELELSLSKRDDAAATCRRLLEVEPANAIAKRILETLANPQTNSPTTQAVVNVPGAAP